MSLHVSLVGQDKFLNENVGSARNVIDDGDDELLKVDGKSLFKFFFQHKNVQIFKLFFVL